MAKKTAPNPSTISNKLRQYREDPVLFCSEILGFEPWDKQCELMRAIPTNRYVACRSGHKCGKTTALAAIALWFICCFPRSRVVMTAPAAPQIERGIWSELCRLYHQAAQRGMPLGGTLNDTPWSGLKFSDGRDVFGRSTKQKENFAGISAPNLMILVDEGSGIEEEIWEAIFGNSAGGAWVVTISNPTQLSGRFYDLFHGKGSDWFLHHISSEDTPNFKGKHVPGLAMPSYARFIEEQYGKPSPHYSVRVLGDFPDQAENSVIGFGLVERAVQRGKLVEAIQKGTLTGAHRDEIKDQLEALEALVHPDQPLVVGVDVARFGDDSSVFTPCRGLRIWEPKLIHNFDVVDVSGHAYQFARSLARPGELPLLRVDANGLGAGVYDHLKRREHIRSVDVNVSERADDPVKYVSTRDELWFGMRAWLEAGGVLPANSRLRAELIAPTYSFDVKGRYKVESKKDIKERLKRSPDVADSACLAVARAMKVSRGKALKALVDARKSRVM